MKRNLLILAIAATMTAGMSAGAFATDHNNDRKDSGWHGDKTKPVQPPKPEQPPKPPVNNTNGNKNTNLQGQAQGQLQGQAQGQLQGQAQGQLQGQAQGQQSTNTNTNTAGNNTNTITVNAYDPNAATENAAATRDAARSLSNTTSTTEYKGSVDIVTPGIASVPNIYPTSPCMGTTSAGVSFMGGAVSGGTSWKDDDCSFRETARMFDQLGYKKDGLTVMCESAYAKAAPSCQAIAAANAEKEAVAAQKAAQRAAPVQAAAPVAAPAPIATAPQQTDKRKTDATIKSSATSCSAPAVQKIDGWKFDNSSCQWVSA